MRIWLVPSAFAPHRGGVEELTLKLAQELSRRGHEVLVVTQRYPLDLPEHDVVEGIVVRRLDFASPGRTTVALARFFHGTRAVLVALDRLPRPDVMHIQCPSNQTAAIAWWSRRRQVPLIITSQGEVAMDAHRIYQRSRYLRIVLRCASRRSARLTACSAWTAQAAAAIAPAFSDAAVIYNGVDASDWSSIPPPPDAPVFGAWGRHVHQKGFDLLLAAFADVKVRIPDARLLLAGDGPETDRLRRLAGSGVELLGPLDRAGVRQLLTEARVVVVPSRVEPFGIVAVEALAAGRQCVYAAGTGLAEAMDGLGRAVDVARRDLFADALAETVVANVDSDAARARARSLDWSVITNEYERVYREVRETVSR